MNEASLVWQFVDVMFVCVHQIMLHAGIAWLHACHCHVNVCCLDTGEKRSRRERLAELLDFATEHFLSDAELAQQHAPNLLVDGLYSEQYWVSSKAYTLQTS